ncbi:MAG: low specificity L-threonine aldolase [Bacteroidales bacterium]|nr:low specificity L-threonine aldolase [Bacteroidales bacterium]
MKNKRGFASDNNSGIHPDILEAMQNVNSGHVVGYGGDLYTEQARQLFKEHFGKESEVFFVFTGTAANVLGLTAGTSSFNSIICPESAHINEDECGAPEKFSGCKLLPVETHDGKITEEGVKKHIYNINFEHHSQPKIISISQASEMGTVYSISEIKALADFAHQNNMYLHMDGARLANAAISLNCTFREMTGEAGVDILSFGGTKNGLMVGESVVFFKPELYQDFKYLRKQGMQLSSKMRFIAAQFIGYFKNDLWKKNASHANNMARILSEKIKNIPSVKITQKVQSNGVFAIVPKAIIKSLQEAYFFYVWNEDRGEVRWMTSFDTTEDDINNFVEILKVEIEKLNS